MAEPGETTNSHQRPVERQTRATDTQTRSGGSANPRRGDGRASGRGQRGRGDRRSNRGKGNGQRGGSEQQQSKRQQSSASAANAQSTQTISQEGNGATLNQSLEGEDPEAEVCFICASPVVHQSVAPCNHRTCHICALRLRALYKTRACAHCRVCMSAKKLILSLMLIRLNLRSSSLQTMLQSAMKISKTATSRKLMMP